jgi:hypothetical protein
MATEREIELEARLAEVTGKLASIAAVVKRIESRCVRTWFKHDALVDARVEYESVHINDFVPAAHLQQEARLAAVGAALSLALRDLFALFPSEAR